MGLAQNGSVGAVKGNTGVLNGKSTVCCADGKIKASLWHKVLLSIMLDFVLVYALKSENGTCFS